MDDVVAYRKHGTMRESATDAKIQFPKFFP